MPNKARQAKNKGREGQNEIRDMLRKSFPSLEDDDIKGAIMGETGADIKLSPAAQREIPLSIEVKRRKSGLKTLYDWYAQAKGHAGQIATVFFRADRSKWLVVLSAEDFIKLIKEK